MNSRALARAGQLPVRLIVVVGFAVLGGIALFSLLQIGPLKQQVAEKDLQLSALSQQRDALEQQLMALQEEQQRSEGRLNDLRSQMTSASEERDRFRAELDDMRGRLQTLQEENGQVQAQITALTKERDDVLARMRQVEQEKSALDQSNARLKNRLAFLDRDYRQLANLQSSARQSGGGGYAATPPPQQYVPTLPNSTPFQTYAGPFPSAPTPALSQQSPTPRELPPPSTDRPSIELAPIVVRRSQAEVLRSLRARVVEVNEVHRFVVIDKGSADGVEVGMTFDVLRSGAMIGQVVVIRNQPRLAAGEVVAARSQGSPQVGDLVIQSGS